MNLLLHSLYSPFFWFFWGSVTFWILSRPPSSTRKRLWKGYGAGLLLVGFLASPLGNQWLHWTLVAGLQSSFETTQSNENDSGPRYLLVAAGGYLIMPDPREDVLSTMTAVRVAAAAKVHSRFPQATLVMQGTGRLVVDGDKEIRHAARQGELMSQLAISLGVPSDKILMEVESRNSREHLDEILSFPGVNRKTPLGIVSADWHLRRLRLVFSEDFDQVWYFPASEPPVRVSGMARIWPTEGALSVSRLYLREWGAIIWYKLGGRSSGR